MFDKVSASIRSSSSAQALIGTCVGSAPGFILPFAIIWHFSTGRLTDAYFYAYAIGLLVVGVLTSLLETNVIPVAIARSSDGAPAFLRFVRRTCKQSFLAAGAGYMVVFCAGLIVVTGRHAWTPTERRLCLECIALLAPYVLAISGTAVLTGALYGLNDFLVPTGTQCARTIIPLMFLLVTPPTSVGILITTGLLAAGELLRLGTLALRLKRRIATHIPTETSQPVKSLWHAAWPSLFSLLVINFNPVIDRTVAANLALGGVTTIDLGEKLLSVPVLAISASIVIVAGTRWARQVGDVLRSDFWKTSRNTVGFSFALAAIMSAAAGIIAIGLPTHIRGLATQKLMWVVVALLAGLPPSIFVYLASRLLVSVQRTRPLIYLSLSSFSVNLVGDIVGAHFFGLIGIAMATSAVRYVNAGMYVYYCKALLGSPQALSRSLHIA